MNNENQPAELDFSESLIQMFDQVWEFLTNITLGTLDFFMGMGNFGWAIFATIIIVVVLPTIEHLLTSHN